jgi:ferric-dicitrate binding protein FerR (iron transport regulator)
VTDLTEYQLHQLIDYFEGRGTDAGRAAVEAWITADEARSRAVERLRLAWAVAAQTQTPAWASEAMWPAVIDGVNGPSSTHPTSSFSDERMARSTAPSPVVSRPTGATTALPGMRRGLERGGTGSGGAAAQGGVLASFLPRPRMARWLGAAGAVVLAFVGVHHLWPTLPHEAGHAKPDGAFVRELVTAKGQIASLVLGDGTRVTLGVASRLRIPTDFGVKNRTLLLDGTAYFAVAPDATRPFVVRTGETTTRVLGTEFTVRHYTNDPATTVTVVTGKVALADVVVAAGQEGVRAGHAPVAVHAAALDNATAWLGGRIVFDHVPMRDVVTELNRWYDVQFVLDDRALADEIVTLRFAGRSAEEAAQVIDEVLKTTHRRTATQIILSR